MAVAGEVQVWTKARVLSFCKGLQFEHPDDFFLLVGTGYFPVKLTVIDHSRVTNDSILNGFRCLLERLIFLLLLFRRMPVIERSEWLLIRRVLTGSFLLVERYALLVGRSGELNVCHELG